MLASIGAQFEPVLATTGAGPLCTSGGGVLLGAAGNGLGAMVGVATVMGKGGVQPVRHSVPATRRTATAPAGRPILRGMTVFLPSRGGVVEATAPTSPG